MKIRKFLSIIAVSVALFTMQNVPALAASYTWINSYNYRKQNGTYLNTKVVTPDQNDYYLKNELRKGVIFSAPQTNISGNLRQFFWPANSPDVMDGNSCSVWGEQTQWTAQQGAALRIVDTPEGTRGITVTKNIFYGATWIFNVHVWDTASTNSTPYTQIAGFDMSEVFGNFNTGMKPFPWNLCARAINNRLQFKVWPSDIKQPTWTDPIYNRETVIPDAWVQPGKTGWYIGHLTSGNSATFSALWTQYRIKTL